MADFDRAITLLPEYTTDGRVNKQVARGFKAKTALYFANPECQHYVADGYQTAATATKAIIDSGHYGLYDEGYTPAPPRTIPATTKRCSGASIWTTQMSPYLCAQHRQPQQGYQLHRLQLLPETRLGRHQSHPEPR